MLSMRMRSITTLCPFDPNEGAQVDAGVRQNRRMKFEVGKDGVESIVVTLVGTFINRRWLPMHLVGPGDPLPLAAKEPVTGKPLVVDPATEQALAEAGLVDGWAGIESVDPVKLAGPGPTAEPVLPKREDLAPAEPATKARGRKR